MQIDPMQRCVRLSARELAIFRNRPSSQGYGHSPWRANLGQKWHQTAESESRLLTPNARFEYPIKANWRHKDWTFQINGRIDQLLPSENGHLIREVKTIRSPLPSAEHELLERYPDYFAQASIYQALLSILPEYINQTIRAEVLFINIENGARQSVPLEATAHQRFEDQLDQLLPFLEERRNSHLRLQNVDIQPAFETLRPGQAEHFEALHDAALEARIILAQAPTGFGKTGIVLEHALRHMQSGLYERCIYLSSKSTGQLETIRQLRQMIGKDIRFLQMRNRSEHRIESTPHTCTGDERCNEGLGQKWFEADLHAPELLAEGTFSLEQAKTLGAKTGICPYALTKACLPFAEIWIGDSNYIFAPESQSVFLDAEGFAPERTLLIVDEAHNLPQRTADSLSLELSSADLLFAIEELREHGAPRRLLAVANEICRWIDELPGGQALNANELYTGLDLCEDFADLLAHAAMDYDSAPPFAIQLFWSIPALAKSLSAPPEAYLHWLAQPGVLHATCLDASDWIYQCLQPFAGTVLMSATLEPFDTFRMSCGLPENSTVTTIGHAAWRESAYDVAIDSRVDTRLRARDRHYETTAQTVAQLCRHSPGRPVAVFFASYLYAENIQAYLDALAPELRIQRQPRGVDLEEQKTFLEEGLLMADALFLILGSSYAEGIDQLGGQVDHIMIVGPALPEVNLIQKTKMDLHSSLSRDEAFRDVYIRPAMRRIHQALGRIVRAPGHQARVLLHGERFIEPIYYQELAPEYKKNRQIVSEDQLIDWLQSS